MTETIRPRLVVLGTGYLGATHAACMADVGFDVLGLDVDPNKIELLNSGQVPFYEPGLPEVLERNLAAGRLRFTTSYDEVGAFGDVFFVCVGTPQKPGEYAADMTYIDDCIAQLVPHLRPGVLVVGKSTVPAGTARRLQPMITATGARLAWNPEFLREGFAVKDTLHPDRLVIGVDDAADEATLREVYAPLLAEGVPMVVTDFATAELVKVSANAFLATKISFINAMAEVCEATGGDVTQLSKALSYDTRIGGRFLHAGLGFGGGCLPKDIRAFMARAGELGVDQALSFLREVDAINLRRRSRVVDLGRELLEGSFAGARVAVLGAAFKPESDDIRDSPALAVAQKLHEFGAMVTVTDPQALDNARKQHPELDYVDDPIAAVQDADLLLHLTEWPQYSYIDPHRLAARASTPRVIDGRGTLNADTWRKAGWTVRALGRP